MSAAAGCRSSTAGIAHLMGRHPGGHPGQSQSQGSPANKSVHIMQRICPRCSSAGDSAYVHRSHTPFTHSTPQLQRPSSDLMEAHGWHSPAIPTRGGNRCT